MPRKSYEIGTEEARKRFLNHVRNMAAYWRDLPNETVEERLNGLAFSILVAIDGGAGGLPKFIFAPDPHPTDRAYHVENDEPFWPENHQVRIEADISGCLHEMLAKGGA